MSCRRQETAQNPVTHFAYQPIARLVIAARSFRAKIVAILIGPRLTRALIVSPRTFELFTTGKSIIFFIPLLTKTKTIFIYVYYYSRKREHENRDQKIRHAILMLDLLPILPYFYFLFYFHRYIVML